MFDQIFDFLANYSFPIVMVSFVLTYAVVFYRNGWMIRRNTASGEQIMDAYLKLRTFRARPSGSEFKLYMTPDERKRLAQSLINLEDSRNEI